ncbi:hypothetical protein TD95_004892 [Thielaviopsis punctulata]|uniref:WHIM1 domain-containing protein n=1 Tax=Thielaviopsis punctulata TaxID=72032 RepID=A0A0F4ZAQ8_9PEZI|nr:hypothetical protein TD95_004892 [Thielaviopsis punctulata]
MSDDSSDLSSISSLSPAPSDTESEPKNAKKTGILKFFKKTAKPKSAGNKASKEKSPPPRKREPSPEHEYVFADNPDIAFIVMFRSRFSEVFSSQLATFGPQELENDITDFFSGNRAEAFLCALLVLILNRKQDIKPGHYGRALEEAIGAHKNQWPKVWGDKSPVAGNNTFQALEPTDKLVLLRTLIQWALSSSESVRTLINKSYKNRQDEDRAIPLSIQPWGSDSDKRRYFLIEGRDGTSFRIYRESNPQGFNRTWWSVADSIESLKQLADKLEQKDGGPKAKSLAHSMRMAIPRLEESEEKRRRREYRLKTKERFLRPELGQSLYEGRTRGKRVKYTFSDEEDVFTDYSTRRSARSTRNQSPYEESPAPVQHTRSTRSTRLHPEVQANDTESLPTDSREESVTATGRPRRQAVGQAAKRKSPHDSELEEEEAPSPEAFDADDDDEHVPENSGEESADDELLDDDVDDKQKTKVSRAQGNVSSAKNDVAKKIGGMLSPTVDGNGEAPVFSDTDPFQTPGTGPLETPEESPSAKKSTPEPTTDLQKSSIALKSPPSASKALAFRGGHEKKAGVAIASEEAS